MTEPADSDRWFRLRDRAAFLPGADALVLADLHLGRGRTSNVQLPLPESEPILDRLGALLETFQPATVVFAGDVCHAFDRIPDGVAETIESLEQRVSTVGATSVFVAGNHDTMLDSLVGVTAAHELPDGTVVCHGDERPGQAGERYVVGHDHPAIEIEGRRRPCFLWGTGVFDGADVLALPAFTDLAEGTLVNGIGSGDAQSPLLADLEQFRPLVRDADRDETLEFPRLGLLREYL